MKRASTYSGGKLHDKLDENMVRQHNPIPGIDKRSFSQSLHNPRRNMAQSPGIETRIVQYPQRPAITLKIRGKEVVSPTHPTVETTPSPASTIVSPVHEKLEWKRDSDTRLSWSTVLGISFITSYLFISFGVLGLTLSLVLSSLPSPSPLLIYTLAVVCFSIIILPTIVLSGHRGLILFFGITVFLLLLTSAMAIAFAMTPTGDCSNPDYIAIHALTGGSSVRCQMVLAQCALLWIDLAVFIGSAVLTYKALTGEKVKSGDRDRNSG